MQDEDQHHTENTHPPIELCSNSFPLNYSVIPQNYSQVMKWGTYSRGNSFSLRSRSSRSLLSGIAWCDAAGTSFRFNSFDDEVVSRPTLSIRSNEKRKITEKVSKILWEEHDGAMYGRLSIVDETSFRRKRSFIGKNKFSIKVNWLKHETEPAHSFQFRIDADFKSEVASLMASRKSSTQLASLLSKSDRIDVEAQSYRSLFVYMTSEDENVLNLINKNGSPGLITFHNVHFLCTNNFIATGESCRIIVEGRNDLERFVIILELSVGGKESARKLQKNEVLPASMSLYFSGRKLYPGKSTVIKSLILSCLKKHLLPGISNEISELKFQLQDYENLINRHDSVAPVIKKNTLALLDNQIDSGSNFLVFQILMKWGNYLGTDPPDYFPKIMASSHFLRIDTHFFVGDAFLVEHFSSNGSAQVRDMEKFYGEPASDYLTHSIALRSAKFRDKFNRVFPASNYKIFEGITKRTKEKIEAGSTSALSNLMGGFSYFSGRYPVKKYFNASTFHSLDENSIANASARPQYLKTPQYTISGFHTMVSFTPSSLMFPRPFLWDEGFHLMVVNKWQPLMSMDSILHWLQLMNPQTGWIPREPMLDEAARFNIDRKFWIQHELMLNPPSLFLPILDLVDQAMLLVPRIFHKNTRKRWHVQASDLFCEFVDDAFLERVGKASLFDVNRPNQPKRAESFSHSLFRTISSQWESSGRYFDQSAVSLESPSRIEIFKSIIFDIQNGKIASVDAARLALISSAPITFVNPLWSSLSRCQYAYLYSSVRFVEHIFPFLRKWFQYMLVTQSSATEGYFRWQMRSAELTLGSGLDDFPRGFFPNAEEAHLDLHTWLIVVADSLERLCGFLHRLRMATKFPDPPLQSKNISSLCQFYKRKKLELISTLLGNSDHTTGKFFNKDLGILTDFLGKCPHVVNARGAHDLMVPPWREDSRCGRNYPNSQGFPSICNPQGMAPCCSKFGWCGYGNKFCNCRECVKSSLDFMNYTKNAVMKYNSSYTIGAVSLFPLAFGLLPVKMKKDIQTFKAASVYDDLPLERDFRMTFMEVGNGNSSSLNSSNVVYSSDDLAVQKNLSIAQFNCLKYLLKYVVDENFLFSPHGLRSLSKSDSHFHTGEDYWRGNIWVNVNFLFLRGFMLYYDSSFPPDESSGTDDFHLALNFKSSYRAVRSRLVQTILSSFDNQETFFEHYNEKTGRGGGAKSFTGWTTTFLLIIHELY
ncbi:mannosyl-oligosaccharide glucosidase [Cardiosporidium cionae]|uniref:Mannosyl-oligosaccharide glucosidase n=1 Tax=Cardiosporidium cionae TaxID=476202 RepID=A0ABQ7JD59_9APIC|nr:mannosyl-oligosaccharide glucosidase [Cardiosporidium cionae]|eukprot:KAF8821978.1 mannosyl-oligosaccharide glucosidase [Cardiosporidium cionae]